MCKGKKNTKKIKSCIYLYKSWEFISLKNEEHTGRFFVIPSGSRHCGGDKTSISNVMKILEPSNFSKMANPLEELAISEHLFKIFYHDIP